MALNAWQLQKKRERKAARRRRRTDCPGYTPSPIRLAEFAARQPIHACLAEECLFEVGLGNVVLSRRLPDGDLAIAGFLTDLYCRGVKDAMFGVVSPSRYRALMARLGVMRRVAAPCARKLVEGAVAYARSLMLPPHPDYAVARRLFGDVDPGECAEDFHYGRDGRPFFVAGPRDTPARIRAVLRALEKSCGPDGYDTILPLNPDSAPGMLFP